MDQVNNILLTFIFMVLIFVLSSHFRGLGLFLEGILCLGSTMLFLYGKSGGGMPPHISFTESAVPLLYLKK